MVDGSGRGEHVSARAYILSKCPGQSNIFCTSIRGYLVHTHQQLRWRPHPADKFSSLFFLRFFSYFGTPSLGAFFSDFFFNLQRTCF